MHIDLFMLQTASRLSDYYDEQVYENFIPHNTSSDR
jgi:hypothetical protein